jgi:hypothetical protein
VKAITLTIVGVLVAGAVGARAATLTSIADIIAAPATYADTEVTVAGNVTQQTVGFGGESLYTIRGDQRVITVVSHAPAPAPGTHLEVTATVAVRPPDEEFTFPPVLVEHARATP